MEYIRRRDRIIIKLPKVTDFYVCTLIRKENDKFYVKLDRGDYFSFKNKDLIVERAIDRNCPELITIDRIYDYILGIGDKEGHINKPETEEILKRISSEQEIQKQAVIDKKEMKEEKESKNAKSISDLKKKKYEDGEEIDDSVEIEEEPEEVNEELGEESEAIEEPEDSEEGNNDTDEEPEDSEEENEQETSEENDSEEELDETDKMLKVDEEINPEVAESDNTEKEEVNPEVEIEESTNTEEPKESVEVKDNTEKVDESVEVKETEKEPEANNSEVDESEEEIPEEVDELIEVEESKDNTEEVEPSEKVEEPEVNTEEVDESEEEIPEEEVDESIEVEEIEEPVKKAKVKSNFPLTDEDNVSELVVCEDNRNKGEGDLSESIYSNVMLQAARSFEKGDRLIIRAKGTLTFYLATVTMNRKGLIYLLLDKGDKLSLKPSSSLIMGFGKQKLCKYAINKNQLHRFMVKPFNALSKIQNLSNRKKMSPKELHESVKEYIPEKQNNAVPYKVVEQKEKLKNVGPYPVKEKKDFVKYLSPLTDSEIDEMIK